MSLSSTSAVPDTSKDIAPLGEQLDELLSRRLRHIVLPPAIQLMYNKRTIRGNRYMMTSWAIGVGVVNFSLTFFDFFLLKPALLPVLLEIRASITIGFLLAAQFLIKQRFSGYAHLLVILPCLITFCLASMMGILSTSPVLFMIYMFLSITTVFTAIIYIPLHFKHTLWLAVTSIALLVIFTMASPIVLLPAKLEIVFGFSCIMGTLVYARRVQNLHQHRAFLLQTREELRFGEANKRSELLSNIAYTDQLTDIPNRRYFDEIVETLHAQPGDALPLSLCLIDIDHFKKLNDQLGHLQGDRCLRLVAACLHHNMRDKNDVLARYGGEEFVILLPGTNAEQAWIIADRIRHAIMELNHPNPGTASGVVTISMGLATVEHGPLDIESLLREADKALYRAKANGRNKVEA